jgi:Holliday junction resolvasome RuvABC endonuclease subunit
MKRFVVGLDASINGTGVTIYDKKEDFYYFYTYTDRNKVRRLNKLKKEDFYIITNKYELSMEIQEDFSDVDQYERYMSIADKILRHIFSICNNDMHVYLEDYAYGQGKSSNIAEYTSILKYGLYKRYGRCISIINNKAMKKAIIGNGNADKDTVIEFMKNLIPVHKSMYCELEKNNYIICGSSNFFEDITDSLLLVKFAQSIS